MSSKFSRRRQIQTTPIVCKKGPPPTDIFEPPGNQTPLQAYAFWKEVIPYANLSFGSPLLLPPLSPAFQWYGLSPASEHQLGLYLELIVSAQQWNLSIDRYRTGWLQQTYNRWDINLRSTKPFQTEVIKFGNPNQYFDVHAWVAV